MTAGANGILAMRFQHFAHRQWSISLVALLQSRNVRRRRRYGRPKNILEEPLSADCRRGSRRVRGNRKDSRLTQQSPPVFIVERHAAEVSSIDTADSVMP